jgi:hypothetical protein
MVFLLPTVVAINATSFEFESGLLSIQIQGALLMRMFHKILHFPIIRSSYYKLGDLLNLIQVDVL